MPAAKRRHGRTTNGTPVVPPSERQAVLLRQFRNDLTHWIETHPRTALRIMRMIEEILNDPHGPGIGKPEALQHEMAGQWSRRITDEHRLVYRVGTPYIVFALARWHYGKP